MIEIIRGKGKGKGSVCLTGINRDVATYKLLPYSLQGTTWAIRWWMKPPVTVIAELPAAWTAVCLLPELPPSISFTRSTTLRYFFYLRKMQKPTTTTTATTTLQTCCALFLMCCTDKRGSNGDSNSTRIVCCIWQIRKYLYLCVSGCMCEFSLFEWFFSGIWVTFVVVSLRVWVSMGVCWLCVCMGVCCVCLHVCLLYVCLLLFVYLADTTKAAAKTQTTEKTSGY